jgi:hypothetical protein
MNASNSVCPQARRCLPGCHAIDKPERITRNPHDLLPSAQIPRAQENKPSGLRSDIQGLRALAVVAVIFDHIWAWRAGGFVGVDVFFVIIGFLITGLLLREHERSNHISCTVFCVGVVDDRGGLPLLRADTHQSEALHGLGDGLA